MDQRIRSLRRIVSAVRENIDSDMPIQQLALLLLVAESGEEGVTMPEAGEKLKMGQTSVSKNAKVLSRWAERKAGEISIRGYNLIDTAPDLLERRRLRMTINERGWDVLKPILREVPHPDERVQTG